MNCEKAREIILTDYLDGELTDAGKAPILEHLRGCPACREFETRVKATAIAPFAQAPRVEPPARLWKDIRMAIEARPKFFLFGLRRPRSIFALSSAFAIALIVLLGAASPRFFARLANKQMTKAYLEEQVDFFAGQENPDAGAGLEAYL